MSHPEEQLSFTMVPATVAALDDPLFQHYAEALPEEPYSIAVEIPDIPGVLTSRESDPFDNPDFANDPATAQFIRRAGAAALESDVLFVVNPEDPWYPLDEPDPSLYRAVTYRVGPAIRELVRDVLFTNFKPDRRPAILSEKFPQRGSGLRGRMLSDVEKLMYDTNQFRRQGLRPTHRHPSLHALGGNLNKVEGVLEKYLA